ADGKADDIHAAASCTLPPLAERCAVGVVVERRGKVEPRRDAIAQREILPAEVRSNQHDAAIERTRSADADADEIIPARVALLDGIEYHALHEPNDSLGDTFIADRRIGR